MKVPLRSVIILTVLLNVFFTSLQVLLVYRINKSIGIDDFWFSLGDLAMFSFTGALQMMAVMVMIIRLCPQDQEGASFATFTSINNIGFGVATIYSNLLLNIWDCSNEKIARHEYDGLGKLTILTMFIQIIPVFFIRYLPASPEAQKKMLQSGEASCLFGGLLVLVLLGSITASVGTALGEMH